MLEGFINALKWYVLVGCAIIGTSAFMISEESGSVNPIIIGILGYGVVYIMATFWTEFRRKVLLISIIVFLVLSFASPYFPYLMYVLFGHDPFYYNQYYVWGLTMGLFGIPIMSFVFYKYGD